MKNLKIILSLIILTFLQSGCNFTDDTQFQESSQFGKIQRINVCGRVLDENRNPIPNAVVSIKNKLVYTDTNGFFIISDAEVFEDFGYVKVEKNGYINASRSFIPNVPIIKWIWLGIIQ